MKAKMDAAELWIYVNGESYICSLTLVQVAVIGKILGLQIHKGTMSCYSDNTLEQLAQMQSNPLKLQEKLEKRNNLHI